MASMSWDPSVGALLRYGSVTVIIVLDSEPGLDWTDGGKTFIELAAVLTIHTLDVGFPFRAHGRTRASPVAKLLDTSLLIIMRPIVMVELSVTKWACIRWLTLVRSIYPLSMRLCTDQSLASCEVVG